MESSDKPQDSSKPLIPGPDTEEGQKYAEFLAKKVDDYVKSIGAVMFGQPGCNFSQQGVPVFYGYIVVQPKAWYDKPVTEETPDEGQTDGKPAEGQATG